jgi:calcineurin-like phosphoesterase family protein
MATFFISDTHFGHDRIIGYCNRPFKDYREMDRAMEENWNAVVGKGDTVWHLGDFAFGRDAEPWYIRNIADRLHGHIHLIRGNHDALAENQLKSRFASISDYKEITEQGHKIVLFHYGLRTWHHDLRGTWHLYGHSHGGLPPYGKSLDIGVDDWNFTPVSFAELKSKMDKLQQGKHPAFAKYEPTVKA